MPIGHRKHGHPVARCPHVGVGLHPFGDQQGGVTRARHFVVPDLAHLGGRLQVVAVTVELEAIRIREGLAGLHTQQSLMVVGGVAGHVVAVIGGKRRNVERASDLEQTVTDPAFDGQPVVHQLKEVVVRSDDLPPLRRGFERLPILAEPQAGLHLPDGHPVVMMMPSACSAMSSASMRDHLLSWPSKEACEDSLNRLRRPVAFSAIIVRCV